MTATDRAARPRLDQMTDDDLDALYARLDALEQPAPASLRDQYATAISKWHRDPEQPLYTQGADAVLAVRDAEMQQLRARVAELEQQAAIDTQVMAKGDADWNEAREAVQKWRAHAEQWQKWGEQHRDRADRYRYRLAKSEQGRRNLRGLLEHHRDQGSLGALRAAHNRLDRALRACARYRARVAELEAAADRPRAALRHLMHALGSTNDTDESRVDRVTPDRMQALVAAVADALPDMDPAEERDLIWSHYRRTHRVLARRLARAEAALADADATQLHTDGACEAVQRAETAEAARDRVRALHQPTPGVGFGPDDDPTPGAYGDIAQACTSCGTADEFAVRWPCPTIRALDGPARPGPQS